MSEKQISPRPADETDSAVPVDDPAGSTWLQPVMTFGLRAAALAGLVVPVGMVIGSLVGDGGAVAEAAPLTTCCPERPL
ncbi:hypothetical protein [Micromonospora sp. KLBMP9576]|uniref:hypothetical protein n=1 Tax=Micromonospora sp. KLBMP9576 TaxID=3424769 RepID=UPI003D8E4951